MKEGNDATKNGKNIKNIFLTITLVIQIAVFVYLFVNSNRRPAFISYSYCVMADCSDDYTDCTAVDDDGKVVWTGSCYLAYKKRCQFATCSDNYTNCTLFDNDGEVQWTGDCSVYHEKSVGEE